MWQSCTSRGARQITRGLGTLDAEVFEATSNTMTERTVRVNGKDIFVAETGAGAPVILLHGGGPGASGVSNYSRNKNRSLVSRLLGPGHG